jgi:hypothetical protein
MKLEFVLELTLECGICLPSVMDDNFNDSGISGLVEKSRDR